MSAEMGAHGRHEAAVAGGPMGLFNPRTQEEARLRAELELARQQANLAGKVARTLLRGETPSDDDMNSFETVWLPLRSGLRAQAVVQAEAVVEAQRRRQEQIRKLGGVVPESVNEELASAMDRLQRILDADVIATDLY